MARRTYSVRLVVNKRRVSSVVIDPHYEEKHSESVSDETILQIVKQLDGQNFEPDDGDGTYEYFVTDKMLLEGKFYKLVWLLKKDEIYIGIVNCYRRRK